MFTNYLSDKGLLSKLCKNNSYNSIIIKKKVEIYIANKHIKYSITLSVSKMYLKSTVSFHTSLIYL